VSRAAGGFTAPGTTGRPSALRGIYRDDLAARAVYAEGAGIARRLPDAVAVPIDVEDLSALVAWAAAESVSIVPRGSGSGMAAAATGPGVIVDCSRLDHVGAVDVERRLVRCGPGAVRAAVDAAARVHGLRFPVDPSSGAFCTVAGMVAANAAGARSLRFGPARAWVGSLGCVMADGSAVRLRRGTRPPAGSALGNLTRDLLPRWRGHAALGHAVRKESSGYAVAAAAESGDAIDLLAGSEGTLALFTEVELRLTPVAGATASAFALFRSLEDATSAASEARALGASACELLDRTFLDIASGASPVAIDASSEAALLIEAEAETAAEAAAIIRGIADACRRSGATHLDLALSPQAERALWSIRHAASPTLARLDPALKSMQFIEDACVPPESLPAYVRGVRSALASRSIRGVIFGHAGDANVHVNPLIDVRRRGWRADVASMLDEVTALVASLGGTLAGEHGDGRLRTPLMPRVWSSEALECFAEVKRMLDPRGILNPGVKVASGESTTDDALGAIKYDADLPALPPAARAALDYVERERAYASFRLALLNDGG
jgi:FAD/FMN-containing dehydrogenase